MTNIVETDDVFREFLTYKPALQLCCASATNYLAEWWRSVALL